MDGPAEEFWVAILLQSTWHSRSGESGRGSGLWSSILITAAVIVTVTQGSWVPRESVSRDLSSTLILFDLLIIPNGAMVIHYLEVVLQVVQQDRSLANPLLVQPVVSGKMPG